MRPHRRARQIPGVSSSSQLTTERADIHPVGPPGCGGRRSAVVISTVLPQEAATGSTVNFVKTAGDYALGRARWGSIESRRARRFPSMGRTLPRPQVTLGVQKKWFATRASGIARGFPGCASAFFCGALQRPIPAKGTSAGLVAVRQRDRGWKGVAESCPVVGIAASTKQSVDRALQEVLNHLWTVAHDGRGVVTRITRSPGWAIA